VSLEKARTALEEALKSGQDALSDLNIVRTLGLTNDWFGWYKHWEAHDTFFAAIRERRMTFRQGPADQDTKKDINMTSLAAPTEKSKKHIGYKYEVGLDSVLQRMDPRRFERGGSVDPRGKYEHGLHDLSASLMSPDKPTISEQVRWKPPKNVSAEVAKSAKFNKWAVIFMPLGQPQDLALFALLNSMAKEARLRQPAFSGRVVEMRRRITRIKLGDGADIGAAFLNVQTKEAMPAKFRYGLSGALKSSGEFDHELARRLRDHAKNYQGIIASQLERGQLSNEIVMCYRHHDGDRFPIVVKWEHDLQAWMCQGAQSARYIEKGIVFDDWARTREL
jgi:hypothetical protein